MADHPRSIITVASSPQHSSTPHDHAEDSFNRSNGTVQELQSLDPIGHSGGMDQHLATPQPTYHRTRGVVSIRATPTILHSPLDTFHGPEDDKGDLDLDARKVVRGYSGRHVPDPPKSSLPLEGLKQGLPVSHVDTCRIGFGYLHAVIIAVLLLAAAALAILIFYVNVFMTNLMWYYKLILPVVLFLAATIWSMLVTSTSVIFDRSTRVAFFSEKRMFPLCCANKREIPFNALLAARPRRLRGRYVMLDLVLDRKQLTTESDGAFEGTPDPDGADHRTPDRHEDEEDEEAAELLLPLVQVENAPDCLRSWRYYVEWLRNDCF